MDNKVKNELPLEEGKVKVAEKANEATQVVKKEDSVFTPELCKNTINKILNDKDLAPIHGIAKVFAKPFESFRKAFKDPNEADRVLSKEIDFAAQALMANPYLITVATQNPLSLVNSIKNIALTGSTLNPVLKQAYLVPFNVSSKPTVTLMPSYMGLIDVLINNGLVKKLEAHCVFKGDEFKISHGSKEELVHNPNAWGDRSEDNLLGAYYYAVLADGTPLFDQMNKAEIDKIKDRSPSTGLTKDGKQKISPNQSLSGHFQIITIPWRAYKMIPKNGISEDKIRVLEAVFDYDEKAEQNWISEQKNSQKNNMSSFDEEEVEYEEIMS